MIQLRPDQIEFVQGLRDAMRSHQAVMGCAATGFGKTVVSAYITQSALAKGKRVIFSVHRKELIQQTSATFTAFGIPHGFIVSGRPYSSRDLVHIASIDTLRNKLGVVENPDLFVIDEAHMAMAAGWHKCASHFRQNGARVLGNSGSPSRLDGKPLADLFDFMVEAPPTRWLMDHGHLSEYRYFAPSRPDLSKVTKRMGDYAKNELGEVMDRPKLTGDVVDHYRRLADGMRAVAFCVNVAHSQHIAQAFNSAGIPAAHIDGGTPQAERKRIIADFADGRVKVLCNVELVTTGFDLSAQVGRDVPVEACILIRPTMSLALYLQMVGRALRKKPYPAVIIDHAGNVFRHGFPDDPREWSLEGKQASGRKAANDNVPPPPVICEGCFNAIRRPLPPACPHCGKSLVAQAKEIEVAEGELQEQTEADKRAIREQRKREEMACRTLDDWLGLAAKRKYEYPTQWAEKRFALRHRCSG